MSDKPNKADSAVRETLKDIRITIRDSKAAYDYLFAGAMIHIVVAPEVMHDIKSQLEAQVRSLKFVEYQLVELYPELKEGP